MKKFFKFAGSLTLLCAALAGGIVAYKKFFAPDPFEDDFDDDLEDSAEEVETSERGYVSLISEEEKEGADTPETEEVKEAPEEETEESEA